MLQSRLFTKTKKEFPADEESKNAKFLIQAGYIQKEMSGVYNLLPLGLMVCEKIIAIIRDEMNKIDGIEMRTSILQNKDVWEKTNRWNDDIVDNWFKTKLKNGSEIGLSFTNEEAYTNLLKDYISSYKDLPIYVYDFKSIFRNEQRCKSGIMRGREFYWKALYSFSKSKEEHNIFYEKIKIAYKNIFEKCGLGENTFITFASGGTFSKYSHEFQTISSAGEDLIYIDEKKGLAINKEVLTDEVLKDLNIKKEDLIEKKSIEVGNIFSLGTRFSEPIDLKYKNENGEESFVIMGSYGIGITRLMGTIVEVLSDERGIIWPKLISPFSIHLISFSKNENEESYKIAKDIYEKLKKHNIEILFDDRFDKSIGEKLADADLIGISMRAIISEKSLSSGGIEIKERSLKVGEEKIISIDEFLNIYI